METKEVRRKLILDFGLLLKEETNILVLEGVFNALNLEQNTSKVPENQYLLVKEVRENYLKNPSAAVSWEDFEKQLFKEYGF